MSVPLPDGIGLRPRPGGMSLHILFWLVAIALPDAALFAQTQFGDCAACHQPEAEQFKASAHHEAITCQECHGGERNYDLSAQQSHVAPGMKSFDHGTRFRGRPARKDVPVLCGTCHADVARMNPYGLRTDQLAGYWVSGHGKKLRESGEDRVAVCIDCHGTHDILKSDNPGSRTNFRQIPDTCGHCHSNAPLMTEFGLTSDIVDQYRRSVHGRNLLEKGDAGSPNCATCHGNHSAAPPGYTEVGHVCGKCHKQIEEYFMTSVHGRFPVIARCVGCHVKNGHPKNHEIEEASPPLAELTSLYERLEQEGATDEASLRERFDAGARGLSGSVRLDSVCNNCHGRQRTDPHAMFFESNDRAAAQQGQDLARYLADVQFEYSRTTARIDRLSKGVLWLRDESLLAEDAKTELMALSAAIHTLDTEQISERSKKAIDICTDIGVRLDEKEKGLSLRNYTLIAVWAFVAVFATLMYRKYLELKHAYVRPTVEVADLEGTDVVLPRRRWLNAILSTLGATSVVALLWPAIAYVLPSRKRGGADERVSAGKEAGWAVWEVRKVAVRGKPAAVVRTADGFRAFSAVCTHLGCIVDWNTGSHEFHCPCHAATFDAAGQVVSGPPPRPLIEFGVQVVQGDVFVTQPIES